MAGKPPDRAVTLASRIGRSQQQSRNGCGGATYQRYVNKYDHYEGVLDERTFALVARLLRRV
jgi:hypothetical protein